MSRNQHKPERPEASCVTDRQGRTRSGGPEHVLDRLGGKIAYDLPAIGNITRASRWRGGVIAGPLRSGCRGNIPEGLERLHQQVVM